MFCKKSALKNFAKFSEKTPAQHYFLIFLLFCNFIWKDTLAPVFWCEFYKISKNTNGCFCCLLKETCNSYFYANPKIRCFISLHNFPWNNSKNTNYRYISSTGTDHWNSKLSTNIQSDKNNHSVFFNISENLKENQQNAIFLAYSEYLKTHYRSFMQLLTSYCLFMTLNRFLYVKYHISISVFHYYFTILCLYFHHFFLLFSPRDTTRHIP